MARPLSVAIVGAGMGGLATAAALRRVGIDAMVYEQASQFARIGAGIQIGCNAMKVLRALGLGRVVERREPLGLGDVLDRVGVEERIERLGRPRHRRERIACGPAVDLAQVLDDQGVAQFVAQGNAPQPDHRMRLVA
jgi:2-polyprenyl-6-methoxyphenol hydroxylase-like FAD-dependent oxidoreductase